jgi:DNA repair exonuclease SbcCD ATPase subunit
MTQNLPDAPVPRRKQILAEGVIRAKDNVDDFSFSQKSRQSEAEHNMGYYLAELNNRNQELENLVEQQDKDLAALRRENAELRERSMKVVTAAVPPALPDFSNASRIARQRKLLEDKDSELNHLRNQVNHLNGEYSTVAQQRNEARELLRTSQAQLDLVRDESRMQRSRLDIVTNHRDAWRLAAVMFAIAFVGALILGG